MPAATPKPAPPPPAPPARAKPAPVPPDRPSLEVYVEAGDTVLWYAGGDESSPAEPAVVTKVGIDSVDLSVLITGAPSLQIRDGAYHMSHRHARASFHSAGGWRHRKITVASRRMFLAAGILEWRLGKNNEWVLAVADADAPAPAAKPPADPPKPPPPATAPAGSPLSLEK